jgi:biotin carboxyl carrier protein
MIKKLRVTVDGKSYDVTVEMADGPGAPAPASAPPAPPAPPHQSAEVAPAKPEPAPASAAPEPPGSGDVPSPLAGRIIEIVVQPGQIVKQNDHLLTIEAMKMNTFVFAPKAGRVASVNVAVGDAVGEGRTLARIE